jgi:hypothetical protein
MITELSIHNSTYLIFGSIFGHGSQVVKLGRVGGRLVLVLLVFLLRTVLLLRPSSRICQ